MSEPSREAKRILVVIYKLAGGRTDVAVSMPDIMAEANRLRVMQMTDDEFEDFRRQVVADAAKVEEWPDIIGATETA